MSKPAFIRSRSTASAAIYVAALALPAIAAAQGQRPLVLTNITVIDVLSAAPQRPATVLINNGRISGISSDGNWPFRRARKSLTARENTSSRAWPTCTITLVQVCRLSHSRGQPRPRHLAELGDHHNILSRHTKTIVKSGVRWRPTH